MNETKQIMLKQQKLQKIYDTRKLYSDFREEYNEAKRVILADFRFANVSNPTYERELDIFLNFESKSIDIMNEYETEIIRLITELKEEKG